MDKLEAQQIVLDAGIKLLEANLVAGTWGNISQKINDEYFAITPSGRDYKDLGINDIVIVNINTFEYEGSLKPSSESKLHAKLYQQRTDINSIIHTHSLYASIVASARKKVPLVSEDMSKFIGDYIPVTKYAVSGSKKLIENTANAIGNCNAVLLANHGAFCVGESMDKAFITCDVMEKSCKEFLSLGKEC